MVEALGGALFLLCVYGQRVQEWFEGKRSVCKEVMSLEQPAKGSVARAFNWNSERRFVTERAEISLSFFKQSEAAPGDASGLHGI